MDEGRVLAPEDEPDEVRGLRKAQDDLELREQLVLAAVNCAHLPRRPSFFRSFLTT